MTFIKPEIVKIVASESKESKDIVNYGPENCDSSNWSDPCCYKG